MPNIQNMTKKMQKLIVLKAVEAMPDTSAAELYEVIKNNDITGFAYESLYKTVTDFISTGAASVNNGLYRITDEGVRHKELITEEIVKLIAPIKTFKTVPGAGVGGMPVNMQNAYGNCNIVKIVPYNPDNFGGETERDFFLTVLPTVKSHVYSFDGRGLGRGTKPNTIIGFQKNNMIRYIAIMDSYHVDKGCKEMHLMSGSIHELASPISSKDMLLVRAGFRFAQNKQTLDIPGEVKAFKALIQNKW